MGAIGVAIANRGETRGMTSAELTSYDAPMVRPVAQLSFIAAAIVAGLVAAMAGVTAAGCDADLAQTCVGGPCYLGTGGWPGYPSSSAPSSSSGAPSSSSGGPTGDAGDAGPGNALACPTVPQTGDIPCDVFAVIHSICNQCHVKPPQNNAPFPILTYADTQEPFIGLLGTGCTTDAECGPTPGNCKNGKCNGLRFQQMYISIGPNGCPQMPFGEGMLPEPQFSTLYDWLGSCAPPAPAGTGCGCPGKGCDGGS
jgi:hypothetical protein